MIPPVVVDALAAFRLTRLIVEDTIADPPRDLAYEWAVGGEQCDAHRHGERTFRCSRPAGHRSDLHEARIRYLHAEEDEVVRWTDSDDGAMAPSPVEWRHPKVAEFLGCPWCAGFWISIGVVGARRFAPRLWDPVARVLATSAIAGILSEDH